MSGVHYGHVSVGEGKFALEAVVVVEPRGITVTAASPEFAHVGATAQAIPRPEPGRTATVSILAVPCHRDEIPAHDIAAALATRFGVPCAATCGFHVEGASEGDLRRVLDTTRELIDACAAFVERVRRAAWEDSDGMVVSVDGEGRAMGIVPRDLAHEGEGIPHLAFMTFLVGGEGEDARLLLCRRSREKRLWGGVLADACAGHPLPGEELAAAVARRLTEECGLAPSEAPLSQVGHVVYREDHGDGHCENEWCAVFAGRIAAGARLALNEQEVAELRRVSLAEVDGYLAGTPESLAPWVRLALANPQVRASLATLAKQA